MTQGSEMSWWRRWVDAVQSYRFVPTRRPAAFVLLASVSWLVPFGQPWVGLAGLLIPIILALLDVLTLPRKADIVVGRAIPEASGIGDPTSATHELESRWPRALTLKLFDTMPAALGGESIVRSLTLEPRGAADLPFHFTPRARGSFRLGVVALRARGAGGLVERSLRYDLGQSILVTPSVRGIRRFRMLALQHRLRLAGVRQSRRRGLGREFETMREHQPGDDPRRIDWKATARRSKLIAREYTDERGQTIVLAIDAGRLMTQMAGRFARFEYALSSALVLADVAVRAGDRVGLLLFDDEVRAFVPAQRGRVALRAIRQALVPATATMAEPDFAAAFRTLATRQRQRALVVLYTDVIDTRAAKSIVAHLTVGTRHLPVVVAMRDDELTSVATGNRLGQEPTASEVFTRVAAEELVQERDVALQRMRRSGVSVVDVAPDAMTSAVVTRYLEIKARSVL